MTTSKLNSDSIGAFIDYFADSVISDPLFAQRLSDAMAKEIESMVKTKLRTCQQYETEELDWQGIAMEIGLPSYGTTDDIARKMVDPIVKEVLNRHNRFDIFFDHKEIKPNLINKSRKMIYLEG
jgi:hypothetical protein